MQLDPQVEAMRAERIRTATPPLYTLSVAEARAADIAAIRAATGTPEPIQQIVDVQFSGPAGALPARVYRPGGKPPFPTLLYFFGGGWTLGSIDTADGVARLLANAAGCAVVVPGYRLAPEHPFPAAVHDCYAATRWVRDEAESLGLDAKRIAVGGDSAGGNLAAGVTLLARDAGDLPLRAQLLVYPNTDHGSETPSLHRYTETWMFNRHSVDWYWDKYLRSPQDGADPLASPLRAPDLSGLPPALVITAEHDPLRDQAEQYADRLAAAGVEVAGARYDGMVHGFFCMPGDLDAARLAHARAAAFLRAHL
ncbi:MAG: acetyl esterase [Micromonosporaceae bacterium]